MTYKKKGASKMLKKAQEPQPPENIPQTITRLTPDQLKAGLDIIEKIETQLNLLINFLAPPGNPVDFLNNTTHINSNLKQLIKIYEDEK